MQMKERNTVLGKKKRSYKTPPPSRKKERSKKNSSRIHFVPDSNTKIKFWGAIALLLLIGLSTRLHLANNSYFWQDEAETAIDTINLFSHGAPMGTYRGLPIQYGWVGEKTDDPFFLFTHSNQDRNIQHGWLTFVLAGIGLAFEKSTLVMRLPFCFLFLFSGILLCILTLKIHNDPLVSFSAVALYAAFPKLAVYESRLRYYSPSIFIAIATLVLLIREKDRVRDVALPLALIASFHIHLPTFAALFVLYTYYEFQENKRFTNHYLLTVSLIVIQSYAFNMYTGWQLKHYLPFFNQLPVIWFKATYILILVCLFTLMVIAHKIRHLFTKFSLNHYWIFLIAILPGFFLENVTFWLKLSYLIGLLLLLKTLKGTEKTWFIAYAIAILLIIPWAIRPQIRNIIPAFPLLAAAGSAILLISMKKWRKRQPALNIFLVTTIVLVTFFGYYKSYSAPPLDNSSYLNELIPELQKNIYADKKVFVEYNHFPLLFYTDIKQLYYIWNINPEFFNSTKETYFIVLEPPTNRKQWYYYYRNYPDLCRKYLRNPRFFLEYAGKHITSTKVLKSGAKIIRYN